MTAVRRWEGLDTVTPVTISAKVPDGARALAAELAATIEGEVRFDDGSRAAYSTDASNYRQVPIGVVVPRTIDDVLATVDACRRHRVPITSRGGGTSLAGQCTNVAVIIDFSKYLDRVCSIDPDRRLAVVEPGCNLDVLRDAAAEHGLTFGPDPATHDRNTLGGMLGNNSCGIHSVMAEFYGPGPRTADQTVELDVVTYDGHRFTVGALTDDELARVIAEGGRRGEVHRALRDLRDEHADLLRTGYPHIPRRVSGYALDRLLPEHGFDVAKALVGTEGTCVVILHATLRLIEARPARTLVALGYPDACQAADDVERVRAHRPVGLEGLDRTLIDHLQAKGLHPGDVDLLPEGDGFLLVEFGAETVEESDAAAQRLIDETAGDDDGPSVRRYDDEGEEEQLWEVRESGLGATARVPGMAPTHPGWEDAAVPPERVGAYLREFQALLDEFDYHAALYGHFGQGCIHCRIDFDLATAPGVERWDAFLHRAADLVASHGGSLSGEHGDGQARAALLGAMYPPELLAAFARFKDIWDPDGGLNPGKVVRPNRPDQDLRTGPDHALRRSRTHFAFPEDDFDFGRATERCVGVGACRDVTSGTMCPSYMATREEEDSTRGRARLLFELLRGDELDGWRDDAVAESLDLCLACKGCKHECPVNVDMATYKAEFLSHHYARRLRPRVAYSMGLIYWAARAASHAPRLVNAIVGLPAAAALVKRAGGVSLERTIPRFASPPFRRWFERHRRPTDPGTNRVLLWPDTFNAYLESTVLQDAVAVLEHAGYRVEVPPRPLCCGRPLYDFGMLRTAEALWRQTLRTLRPWIRAGVPVVGVEPSCIAAFRDELPNLFPHDEDAHRLSTQTFLLSELLERDGYRPPPAPAASARAIVHGHCHHEAVLDMDAEVALLGRMGVDHEVLDDGCCGMAGSFGFAADHYDVSMRIGERVLLPRVRDLEPDRIVITDGFSCREQIEQGTGRSPVHVATLLHQAIRAEGEREDQR